MRKAKIKFDLSTHIETSNKVLKAVESKLSDEIISCCRIDFANGWDEPTGYIINASYLNNDECQKILKVCFSIRSYDAHIWIIDCTWLKKYDFKRQEEKSDKKIEFPTDKDWAASGRKDKPSYEKIQEKVFKDAVKFIVESIIYKFSSAGEKFVFECAKLVKEDNPLISK